MKLNFIPSEYYSEMDGFKVRRGRGSRWVAAVRRVHEWEVLRDDCASAQEAMDVCTAYLRAWSEAPSNDVDF